MKQSVEIDEESVTDTSEEMVTLSKTAIDEVQTLFEKVRVYTQGGESLVNEYRGYVSDVWRNLKKHFEPQDVPKSTKQIEMLKSKFFLLDVCFEKAIFVF